MKYTQEQYDVISALVEQRILDIPTPQMILHYRWFSLASNIHNHTLVKIILTEIVKQYESELSKDE